MVFLNKSSGIALLLVLSVSSLWAQTFSRHSVFHFETGNSETLVMNGNLDGQNTFTYPSTRAFEPMAKMKLTNYADSILIHPRVVINNKKNWFDIESLRAECFEGARTDKEKALTLWKFIKSNRIHRNEPQCCDEINDPVKLFGVYGYGMCYNTNYANTFIAQGLDTYSQSYSNRAGRHFVSEISFGNQYALIDGDIETFYLKSDNTTLGNYNDIINDKNLIRRTHHYGKSEKYNDYNDYVASAIYAPNEITYYFGGFKNFHSLDVTLRPNESIEYNWQPGKLYHSYGVFNNAEPEVIANGRLIYEANFLIDNLENLIDTVGGISTYKLDGQKPNLHAKSVGTPSSFIIEVSSPFVILDGTIKGNFVQQNINDQIAISFSKDSLIWELVWESQKTGKFTDSVNLYQQIGTVSSHAIYKYFLKFDLFPNENVNSCGIDSLQIITDFQISRFFLPSLQLGNNTVDYKHENKGKMLTELLLEWQESSDNTPPLPIQAPKFPLNEAQIDNLRFTFSWNEPIDPDDEIIDYEFKLSDRMDMKFPLSPSFDVYTSFTNSESKLNEFSIPFDGLLNSGTTYYWKVRAKDARGAWGNWSPVWSFTPQGPMPPIEGKVEIKKDSIILTWNTNLKGTGPSFFEIHGSRERSGFTPDASTLLDTTPSHQLTLPFLSAKTNTFYRVIAIDGNNNKSGPSEVIEAPYPYLYSLIDTVKPLQHYTTSVETNRVYTQDMFELYFKTYFAWQIEDEIETEILSKPNWLNYDSESKTLFGETDYVNAHNSDSVKIKFKCLHSGSSNTQTFKIPIQVNNKPGLTSIDSVAIIGTTFRQSIFAYDPDIVYGDFISSIEIIAKPAWLNASYNADKAVIALIGIPLKKDKGDTVLIVKAFDSLNEPTLVKYGISVQENDKNIKIFEIYPNPFRTSTTARIKIENHSLVKIDVFNLNGERVHRLLDEEKPAGIFEIVWDAYDGKPGIYLLKMQIEEKGLKRTFSKKIIQIE